MLFTWLRNRPSTATQLAKKQTAKKHIRATLGVEVLESRALLSATSLVGVSIAGSDTMIDSFARPEQVRTLVPAVQRDVNRDDPFFRTGNSQSQFVGQETVNRDDPFFRETGRTALDQVVQKVVDPAMQKVVDPAMQKVVDPAMQKVVDAVVQKVTDAAIQKVLLPAIRS